MTIDRDGLHWEVVGYLQGTLSSIEGVIRDCCEAHGITEQLWKDEAFIADINKDVIECECCGWYCSVEDLDEGGYCDECADQDEEE